MRTTAAVVTTACLLGSAAAFVQPALPSRPVTARARAAPQMMGLSPDDLITGTQNLVAIVKENDVFVKNAGDYPWGSVAAPDWALPVAAFATLSFGVLIPLFLKPGVDAFNTGGAIGAEKKAAAVGKPVPTKAGVKPAVGKPAAKPTAAKAGGKVIAKGGAKAAAPPAAAPKKKGWF